MGTFVVNLKAVGCNGTTWVNSGKPAHTVLVCNAILNSEALGVGATMTMVKKLVAIVKEMD